jgi:hypothetical protein
MSQRRPVKLERQHLLHHLLGAQKLMHACSSNGIMHIAPQSRARRNRAQPI